MAPKRKVRIPKYPGTVRTQRAIRVKKTNCSNCGHSQGEHYMTGCQACFPCSQCECSWYVEGPLDVFGVPVAGSTDWPHRPPSPALNVRTQQQSAR